MLMNQKVRSNFGKNTKIYVDLPTPSLPTPLQPIEDSLTRQAKVSLYLKRDDLIHPTISGNKWRKLKYILADAWQQGCNTLLTFGGARSNHLYATAAAGALLGFRTIGVVRGEEYQDKDTETLRFCREQGMHIHAISRTRYRQKHATDLLTELISRFDNPYLIPEGGSTPLALPGVRELVSETTGQLSKMPGFFAVAAGTGSTAAGILSASGSRVLAFPALKGGDFLQNEILDLVGDEKAAERLALFADYHFGGYARHTPELLVFIREFEDRHGVPIEQVYTGKMLYGLYDLVRKGYFAPGSTVVAVHTGGLQGKLTK
jgi:1-aminocyclopropane-1-carboxylate deaminase